MGSFSFMRADKTTKKANFQYGDPLKILIPKIFGGGCIKGVYKDYGDVETSEGKVYDVYELIALWNASMIYAGAPLLQTLSFDGAQCPSIKVQDSHTDENRCLGINIHCYDSQAIKCKYPLKLVSARYKGTYEECEGISFSDPDQGFSAIYRETTKYEDILDSRKRHFRERGIPEELATRGVE